MRLEDWYKKTERPEERALRRKLRRAAILEAIGLVVLTPLSIILFWLLVVMTPDQSSSINVLHDEADSGWIVHFLEEKP